MYEFDGDGAILGETKARTPVEVGPCRTLPCCAAVYPLAL